MKVGIRKDCPTLFWPLREEPEFNPYFGLINGRCIDINKSTVARLSENIFGYECKIDPRDYSAPYVRKSEINARHDGIVLHKPTEPDTRYVYQRLVNNESGDGMVEDLRIIYMRNVLPILYRKLRPVSSRFANKNTVVTIERTSLFISEVEARRIELLSEAIGLEYGEIDALRDRTNGLLYVVDINRTPAGPPNGLPRRESRLAVKQIATSFKDAFGVEAICN